MRRMPLSREPRRVAQQNLPRESPSASITLPLTLPWRERSVPPAMKSFSSYAHGADEKTLRTPWGHFSWVCWLYLFLFAAFHGFLVSCRADTSPPRSSVTSMSGATSNPLWLICEPLILFDSTRKRPSSSVLSTNGSPLASIFWPDWFLGSTDMWSVISVWICLIFRCLRDEWDEIEHGETKVGKLLLTGVECSSVLVKLLRLILFNCN